MKQKIFTITMGMLLMISLAGCGNSNTENSSNETASVNEGTANAKTASQEATGTEVSPTTTATTDTSAYITEEEAKKAALSHAGLSETGVTFLNVNLDTEDGRQVYEVEFYSGNTEYDYDIDATNGDISSYDSDVENYTIPSNTTDATSTGENIGEEAAKSIVLDKVAGAAETDIQIYQGNDDGIAVYEGTIIYNEMKYDFEINAADGTIMEWDSESVYDD